MKWMSLTLLLTSLADGAMASDQEQDIRPVGNAQPASTEDEVMRDSLRIFMERGDEKMNKALKARLGKMIRETTAAVAPDLLEKFDEMDRQAALLSVARDSNNMDDKLAEEVGEPKQIIHRELAANGSGATVGEGDTKGQDAQKFTVSIVPRMSFQCTPKLESSYAQVKDGLEVITNLSKKSSLQ